MRPPGLSAADYPAYVAAQSMSTSERWRVDILTLDHQPVTGADVDRTLDGAVTFTPDADIDRTLTISFLDPEHQLQIDSDDPSDGALGYDRLLQVWHGLFVPGLDEEGRWVDVPVFTGVPSVPERNGDTITIEAQDKACRAVPPRDIPAYTIRKGQRLVAALKDGMRRCGETKFAFPTDDDTRVPKDTPVGGPDEARAPWRVYRRLAKAGHYQLFYRADGYCTLRKSSPDPVVTWYADLPESTLTDVVKRRTDFTRLRNTVRVRGKKGVTGLAYLPASHPFSATALASGGQPCRLTMWYEDTKIGTKKLANAVAARELADSQTQTVEMIFPCVPVHTLEPGDALALEDPNRVQPFRLREATLPFGGEPMSIGTQKRIRTPAARRIRPRR